MYIFFTVLHVLVCFIMIGVILLQSGKGAEIGAAFGGSSQTVFGSRGAATFLTKMTTTAAAIFFVTSLGLSLLSKTRFISSSVIDLNQKPPVSESTTGGAGEEPISVEPIQEGVPAESSSGSEMPSETE